MLRYLVAFVLFLVAICMGGANDAHAQAGYVSNCKISSTTPVYTPGTYQPETCDINGNLYTNGSNVTQSSGGLVASSPPTLTPGTTAPLSLSVGGGLRVTCPDGTCTTLGISQGAPTASQLGGLSFGSVTTSVPTYTTGTVNGLSLTTSGLLRVDASGTTGSTTTNVTQFGGNNVVTGTGSSGLGIPRVTVSSDSTMTSVGSITNALPAGTNILGKVGIDQTTPGSTNGVVIAPTSAAGVGITSVISGAAESSHVLKASAGNLYSVYATNLTTAMGFLVVLNATSAPADGAITPLDCVPLSSGGTASLTYLAGPPEVFSTGITAVVTSANTCFLKTTGVITAFFHGAIQ